MWAGPGWENEARAVRETILSMSLKRIPPCQECSRARAWTMLWEKWLTALGLEGKARFASSPGVNLSGSLRNHRTPNRLRNHVAPAGSSCSKVLFNAWSVAFLLCSPVLLLAGGTVKLLTRTLLKLSKGQVVSWPRAVKSSPCAHDQVTKSLLANFA